MAKRTEKTIKLDKPAWARVGHVDGAGNVYVRNPKKKGQKRKVGTVRRQAGRIYYVSVATNLRSLKVQSSPQGNGPTAGKKKRKRKAAKKKAPARRAAPKKRKAAKKKAAKKAPAKKKRAAPKKKKKTGGSIFGFFFK